MTEGTGMLKLGERTTPLDSSSADAAPFNIKIMARRAAHTFTGS